VNRVEPATAEQKQLFTTVCPKFVQDAVEILHELW